MTDAQRSPARRRAGFVGAALALAIASTAAAADAPLDQANADVTHALTTLKGMENDTKANPDLDQHRKKAIEFLTRAQSEILKAKQLPAPAQK